MISKERAPIYDQTLKRLLTQAHDAVLRLIAPTMHWRSERSPELPASNRQADLVWEVEGSDGRRGLLHVELQVKVEANIRERLLEYSVRLMRRDHLPVHSVVVFLRKARPSQGTPHSSVATHRRLEWTGGLAIFLRCRTIMGDSGPPGTGDGGQYPVATRKPDGGRVAHDHC